MEKIYRATEKYKFKVNGQRFLEARFYEKLEIEELDKIFLGLPQIHTWLLIYEKEDEEPFEISYKYLERFQGRRLILGNILFINDTNSEMQHYGRVSEITMSLPCVREIDLNYFTGIDSLRLHFRHNVNSLNILKLAFLQELNIRTLQINKKRILQRKLGFMNRLEKIGGLIPTDRLLKTNE